jgi:hypothetical protein
MYAPRSKDFALHVGSASTASEADVAQETSLRYARYGLFCANP